MMVSQQLHVVGELSHRAHAQQKFKYMIINQFIFSVQEVSVKVNIEDVQGPHSSERVSAGHVSLPVTRLHGQLGLRGQLSHVARGPAVV